MPHSINTELKELDQHFPAAAPHEYRIAYFMPGEPGVMKPQMKELNQSARTWMSSAGMPRELGNSLVDAISEVIERTLGMTEAQIEQRGYDEFDKLIRAHGEKLNERLESARRMIHDLELKTPGLKNLLKSRGVGDDAVMANLLISHAQIYHARRNARQGRS